MLRTVLSYMTLIDRMKLIPYLFLTALNKIISLNSNPTFKVNIAGINFKLEPGQGELKIIFENNINKIYTAIDGFLPENGYTCIDVGANIGCSSLEWARTNTNGTIYAIEPHPKTFLKLKRHIHLNGLKESVIPHENAIGKEDGEMELFIADKGTMALDPEQVGTNWEGEKIQLPVKTLDTFIHEQNITEIDILKIDIEGFEVDALHGAKKTLELTKRIVLEFHSPDLKSQCMDLLLQAGFELTENGSLLFGIKAIN